MSTVMTEAEREAFLADRHVGVLAVSRDGRAPLAVPIWYGYEPGGDVLLWMDRDSMKDRAIRKAGRVSLVAQFEQFPYAYVSVEGPVVANDEPPTREEALAIAGRYLPQADAQAFVEANLRSDGSSILVRMRPERWLSQDQSKS
ncbi:pyridoxamine 5'-phosphate oxidase family protein [Saccharomonospora xinjiangensis]|uniref:Putative flavin-nucleotide-binding protein n=1 Tax=Saccharomonospora xinjiangensis XJ-54 TaxID=882086 RepID=I0V4E9_9PSEU|nr:pyridoxamine 5'-phosphate oxidase family protein [Saccharomonospora xinjiangensis]EID55002.1 putative flavin-nucleotide-binding protein [Saccharomonospora xinjiangensis XJ-54]